MELRTFLSMGYELFDFPYQFDDYEIKKDIEQAVIDHFYFHEIGQELPERFKHVFRNKFLRAIEYYNQLHNTTLLEYNPLVNYTMTELLDQLQQSTGNEDMTSGVVGTNSLTTSESGTTDDNRQLETNEGHSQHTTGDSTTKRKEDTTQDNTHTKTGSEDTTRTKYGTENTTSSSDEDTTTTDDRTDNLNHTNNTDETTSDYPQQSISAGNYLSGARKTENEGSNTGTVKYKGSSNTNSSGSSDVTTNESGENKTTYNEDTTDNTQTNTTEDTTNNYGEDVDGTRTTTTDEQQQGTNTLETTQTGDNTEDTEQNRQTTGKDKTDYKKTIEGLTGKSYQELIQLERNNILRIKGMIINELKPCFLMVY